jgi:sulfoxide reductase heme-binding subunit YedZ
MQTLVRHLLALGLLIGLIYLFSFGRDSLHALHRFNRAIADASYILLCLTLILGPLIKFVSRLRFLLPWRRELGIAFVVSAVIHVLIYASSFQWDLTRFFSEANRQGEAVMLENPFSIANWIGLIALVYALVLGSTSNDVAQKLLGKGWKFIQQQSYTLFVLVVLHAAIFLYLVFNPQAENGYFRPLFIIFGSLAVGLQAAGFILTVRQNARLRRRRANPS